MLKTVSLHSDSLKHDAGLMLLTVQLSDGGLSRPHHLSELSHESILQQQ